MQSQTSRRSRYRAGLAALWLSLAPLVGAGAEEPAIARPSLHGKARTVARASGVVFFLVSELSPGAVAVGTAHTLRGDDLARTKRVEFILPRSLERAAASTRYATAPGLALDEAGGTLAGDYAIFLLEKPLEGARALEPEPHALSHLRAGVRVRLLGPSSGSRKRVEQQDAFGTVSKVSPEQIEIDLDLDQNLLGWGGAPVLLAATDRVVGMVEAALPGEIAPRVLAAPIEGILAALSEPLEAGAGTTFATYHTPTHTEDAVDPDAAAHLEPTPFEALPKSNVELVVEYPPNGGKVGTSACGTFVAGRAAATLGLARRFDVILVIDTSRSTVDASGADVNGNGEIGVPRMGKLGAAFGASLTDPGDSILAAEIAAARQILIGLDPRSTRVGLVAFAGEPTADYGRAARRKPAYTVEALTRDYTRIERGLDELLDTPPEGSTHMAAGLDQATIELLGLRRAYSKADPKSEKIVFFFTDGQPTLPYPDSDADNVRSVLRAANRARSEKILVHSFAIGPEALEGPIATVEMAGRTGGSFTPVRSPGDLVDAVVDVSFSELTEVRVENRSTKAEAAPFRLTADGSWGGFVKTQIGTNQLRVRVRSQDGGGAESKLRVKRPKGAFEEAPVPRALLTLRNRLLEDCLILTQQRRLEREAQRNAEIRKKLRLEIERERKAARARANAQRKTLDLELED